MKRTLWSESLNTGDVKYNHAGLNVADTFKSNNEHIRSAPLTGASHTDGILSKFK